MKKSKSPKLTLQQYCIIFSSSSLSGAGVFGSFWLFSTLPFFIAGFLMFVGWAFVFVFIALLHEWLLSTLDD